MNHKQLTQDLFKTHFPAWLDDEQVEKAMRETCAAFAERGVPAFYNSLQPAAKRARWEARQTKLARRKTTSRKLAASPGEDAQLTLF